MTELKPCPFCGGSAFVDSGPTYLWYVQCQECLVDGAVRPTKSEAIEAWNRRAQPAQADPWPAVEQINLARADAELLGTGFTVDGLRVSPERVVMIKQNAIAPLTQPDVPEGWVLVPVEPTEEMLAVARERGGHYGYDYEITAEWQAMLAATPKGITK